MKKFLSILGKGLLAILVILVIAVAYVYLSPNPTYEDIAVPDLTLETDSATLARGYALILNNCHGCHYGEDRSTLSGRRFEDELANREFGEIYASNITQHSTAGIGAYTSGELYRLLRTGVKRNHEQAIAVMPTWPLASEQDIYDMIAFLQSDHPMVAAVETDHPAHQSLFLERALSRFVFAPVPLQEMYPERPALADSVAYGAYQINSVNLCYYCHSKDIKMANPLEPAETPGYLTGGFVFEYAAGNINTPGLIPTDDNNVGKWTIEEFVDAIKYGQRPDLPAYIEPMHPYNLLDTAEVRAIYHYLASL
ncbi:MAG: cytochrome c [Bacteroidota bacterium]